MRNRNRSFIFSALVAAVSAHAGVVSRDWSDGKLQLQLDDGAAVIEWISPAAFRVARTWGVPLQLARIAHEKIEPQFEDVGPVLTMRTRYMTVTVDRGDTSIAILNGEKPLTKLTTGRASDRVAINLTFSPNERIFGLMGGNNGRLNIRGEKLEREHGFFMTTAGYGMYLRSPEKYSFDMGAGSISAQGARSVEFVVYFGPTPKEILEQHSAVVNYPEVKAASLDLLTPDRLPKPAAILSEQPVNSWESFAALIRKLNQWSLSGIIYPALDLSIFDQAPPELQKRARDLVTVFPIVYRGSGEGGLDPATRAKWTPYLITYLREAYDRGYPLIRPLPMQFSRDANSDQQADIFMLGDEVLLAPVLDGGTRRKLDLPRGNWTDFRTNQEYPGNRTIEVDAPAGLVPTFVRNGWIVPLAMDNKMELHYFPSLGGEFFLWEPGLDENSQFHAAPAGDFVRVEIESKRRRTYEWILHHTKAPREVAEESGAYVRVTSRAALKSGCWWHDDALNNLHVMLESMPATDRIVNISF